MSTAWALPRCQVPVVVVKRHIFPSPSSRSGIGFKGCREKSNRLLAMLDLSLSAPRLALLVPKDSPQPGSRPALRALILSVARDWHDSDVRSTQIVDVAIDMINVFARRRKSTKLSCGNLPMQIHAQPASLAEAPAIHDISMLPGVAKAWHRQQIRVAIIDLNLREALFAQWDNSTR